jgi:hypothetical protein
VRPVASVLVALSTRDGARATLDAVWSEAPGVPIELLVHATGPARDVAAREHGRRALLVGDEAGATGRPGSTAGAALLGLVLASRARVAIVLAEGARPTPGWARELTALALGAGHDGAPGLAVPRLAAPALAGPQAWAAEGWPPSRAGLRALADRARFDERRDDLLEHALPSAACLALPRVALERAGLPDPARTTPGGALTDLVRRARAAGLPVRLARRALVALDAPLPASPAERLAAGRGPAGQVLAGRDPAERGPGARGERAPAVRRLALELEPDDPGARALAGVALALAVRGVPLVTFSRRAWRGRPTPAPHVVAGLATAAHAADLLLLRGSAATLDAPARRLLLPDEVEAPGDDVAPLRLAGAAETWPDQLAGGA